jgi:hypothetical protein
MDECKPLPRGAFTLNIPRGGPNLLGPAVDPPPPARGRLPVMGGRTRREAAANALSMDSKDDPPFSVSDGCSWEELVGRGLHPSTFQLNLSRS